MIENSTSRRRMLTATVAGLGFGLAASTAQAAEVDPPAPEARIQSLIPALEAYVRRGMAEFGIPGTAVGIVVGDKLVYAQGFGVRSQVTKAPVSSRTVFQVGSTTKAFLATTLAMMVDRGHFAWDTRVADLYPDFQLSDPWVTREFRVYDLLAQRSGLPPYANDALLMLGLDETALIRSLRYVAPISSFRSTFSYTNVTHALTGKIIAQAAGLADWNAVLQQELLGPLGMANSTMTAQAIQAAPDHAEGHLWSPEGPVELPFNQIFPYELYGAGDINSTIEDMAKWAAFQIGRGSIGGRRLLSEKAIAETYTPKVSITETQSYALGWVVRRSPNGTVIWHNGGTMGFGAFVGFVPVHEAAVVVLSNATNVGFPDAIGNWMTDQILGNPEQDDLATTLKRAKEGAASSKAMFVPPAHAQPAPPLAPLAGRFDNAAIGQTTIVVDGSRLVMTLAATGARLAFDAWDGDVLTARLLAEGKFADVAANLGPDPFGFVQYQIGEGGTLSRLKLSLPDGQAYLFDRVG